MMGIKKAAFNLLGILVLSGLVLLPALVPVAATDDSVGLTQTTGNGNFSSLEKLSMGNVKAKSPRLWAFVIGTYWVSFVTLYMLWKAYKHVSELRAAALMAPHVKPEQFAILVRDIPPVSEGQTRKEQVDSYFKMIHPDTFYRSMVVTDNKEVNKIWEELEGYRKKLARAEAIFAESKTTGKPEGTRPTNRVGFLGLIVGGTLFQTFKDIEKHPNNIVSLLGTGLPGNATFFLTFVALKFFVGYGLELSRLVPLVMYHLKRRFLCKTEAELKEAWAPGDLGYATRVPSDMLIIIIVLCYSVIAPIIIPFGVLYFGLGWLILRNQALKVYVPSYESYGRMWPHVHSRILAALIIYQITMLGYFAVKKFFYTPILIPLPVLSLMFGFVCSKKFYKSFQSTPLEVACRELKETPNMESIFRAYIPPCLSSDKVDDGEQFEDALSTQVSRTGSFV